MIGAPRFFLAASLLFGAAFVLATPPFHAPDEPAHFYRTVQISEGVWIAEAQAGRTGGELPASLGQLVDLFAESIAPSSSHQVESQVFASARRIELEPEVRSFHDFPTTSVSTPLTYLPQAVAVAIGYGFGATPLVLLYLARAGNLLASTALIYAGLRQLPTYRWLTAAIALTPMMTFLKSSVSADALTFAIGFCFAATLVRLAFGEAKRIRPRDVFLLSLSAAALCLTKAAYVPLVAAAAILPARRFRRRSEQVVGALFYFAVTGGAFVLAVVTARAIETPFKTGVFVDPDQQMAQALDEPLRFLEVAAVDYARNGAKYLEGFVGRLGWLDAPLPPALIVGYWALLLFLLRVDTDPKVTVEVWQRWILGGVTLATVLLVSASLYAVYTPVGADFIAGLQGRYYLPVALISVWMFHSRRWSTWVPRKRIGVATACVCCLALTVSWVVLIQRLGL